MIGTFLAAVTATVFKESKEKGTPSINITFETSENVETKEPIIKKVYADLWLSEKAQDRSLETLIKTLGWNGDDLNELNGGDVLAGVEAWLVLEEEEYEDSFGNVKTSTKVKWINKIGGKTSKPLDEAKAKSLSDSLKGKVLAFKQNNPTTEEVADSLNL